MAPDTPSAPPPGPPADRLDSWKEIARYLKRDESTVQRWEKREHMPVHRHVHAKRGSVYAYRAELDAWWQGRRQRLEPVKGKVAGGPRRWWIATGATLMFVAIGIAAFMGTPRTRPPRQDPDLSLVRLTSSSGLNTGPALSPDGSLLAYASDRGGAGDLDVWIQPVVGEQATRLTSDPLDEFEPSFSPSGDSIVFCKGESDGIYIIPTGGGEPQQLVAAARARTPRFSPDGRWVTYWTGLPVWVIVPVPHPGGEHDRAAGPVRTSTGALFVVASSGGSPRAIAPDFQHARYGTWSPDGDKLLFLGERVQDSEQSSLDWYVVGVRGGETVRTGALDVLRRAGLKGVPIPGAWTRDGEVVFATEGQASSGVWQLAISPDTGRVDGEPVRLTFGTAIERAPAGGPSGEVVFTSVTENVDVWRLPLDTTTGLGNGPIERVTDNAAHDRFINASIDGNTLAFMSSRTGQDEVWIRDLHIGEDRQMTHSGAQWARLSADGSTLAVAAGGSQKPRIDLVPLGDGPTAQLCDDCYPGDWSPDGTRFVVLRGTPTRLFIRDIRSGGETALAAHPSWSLLQPRFSPDSRWIVFHTANSPSLRQIYAVRASSEGPVPVDEWTPVVEDFGLQPAWAPDGAAVYHFSLRDGAFCAWLQPVDPATSRPAGSPRAVHHLHQPGLRAVTGAAVTNHVAAGYLYVTLTSSAANIWMLHRPAGTAR